MIPTITIANARELGPQVAWPEHFVYVGRAAPRRGFKASPLANPYKVGQYPTNVHMWQLRLDDVLYWYGMWFHLAIIGLKTMEIARLERLLAQHGQLTLVCWCETWDGEGAAPGRCHAEIIREVLLRTGANHA